MATPQWLIAINQLGNALTGGNAYTTLSTRAFMWRENGVRSWPANALDKLFFWHTKYGGHCQYAFDTDRSRWKNLYTSRGQELGLVTLTHKE